MFWFDFIFKWFDFTLEPCKPLGKVGSDTRKGSILHKEHIPYGIVTSPNNVDVGRTVSLNGCTVVVLFSWYYKNHLEETSFLFPSKHLLLGPPKTGSFFQSIPDRARKYCYLAKNGRLNSKFWPIELWADSHSMAVLWCFFPLLNIKHIEAMIIFPWNHQQPKNRQHFQSIPDWVRKYCQQINGRSIFV